MDRLEIVVNRVLKIMDRLRKYGIIAILCISLMIPLFFGIYAEYLYVQKLNMTIIIALLIGLVFFLLLNKLIVLFGIGEESLESFKNHEVINAFISGRDKALILIFFPLIMISEELIFRFYLIGYLLNEIRLEVISAILVSSIIFSIYHVYMWFKYKNKRVFIIYFGSSFLLGLFNGFILLTLGVITCVLIHYFLVIELYYSIFKRNFKKNRS